MHYLAVALGGALGSVLRYAFSLWFNPSVAGAFPKGTFLANVLGCFCIGIFAYWASLEGRLSDDMKLLLLTGFCGGFTTFSTFSSEGLGFLKNGQVQLYAVYTIGSLVLGLAAVWVGFWLGRQLT